MIKVVQLVPRDGIGGVESAARSMMNAKHLQCDFNLVFIEEQNPIGNNDGFWDSLFRSENSPVAHFRAFRRIVSFKPDLLLCSLWRTVPIGIGFKLMRPRTKLVFFLHLPTTTHVFDRLFSRLMLSFCDAVWADSAATISSRIGSKEGFVKRVISFVTSSNPESMQKNEFAPRFVFWGRLHNQKGLDRAIRFIQVLTERGCSATFEIWGPDGGEENLLIAQIESAGLTNDIVLNGSANQDELNQIAEQSCFYLQLSRNEGMAMSVVEAMQRSLVPVVTPVGEIGTYCSQDNNAIIVHDPDNSIEAVNRVLSIMEDESQYRQLQEAAFDTWAQHILYKDDICAAAIELCKLD